MNNLREFSELLKGCRPVKDSDGNIVVQTIMNMSIVCLTTDKEYSLDDRFANPLTALSASNSSYGRLTFQNSDSKDVIIPTQMAVMTKQMAQNHSMIKAGYLSKNSKKTYYDAGCVQGLQCGYISNTKEFRILPVTMREMALDTAGNPENYSRIYPAVEKLGYDTQSDTSNYLNKYFERYDKKLEQFIAHFERPNDFIGMIVFIDDEIVAIDKFPSFTYAEQVWNVMIRDCYGSLAIISELKNKMHKNDFTNTYNDLKKSKSNKTIIELIEESLNKTKEKITSNVYNKISEILDMNFDTTYDTDGNSNSSNEPKSYFLNEVTCNGYIGQVISENDFNFLVSIVKRESFDPKALQKVNELKNKARNQQRFSL